MNNSETKGGFTIVEVLIAIVILAVGMLALATTSVFATTQVKIADLRTEQSLAVQQAIEQLRAGPWTSVADLPEERAISAGSYTVWWDVSTINPNLRQVDVITRGPGYAAGRGWMPEAVDTFTAEIANASL